MASDQIFNPALWYLFLALMAVAVPLYVFVLWQSWKWALGYLGVYFCFAVYMAFFSVHNFGGAFGTGMVLSCLTVLLIPISIILLVLLRRPFRRQYEGDLIRRRLYVVGGLFLIGLQLFPLFGSYSIDTACFRSTQRNAAPVIAAVETYRQDHGVYPPDMQALQPAYLSEIPILGCTWLSTQAGQPPVGFEIYACDDDAVLLTNESTDGTSIERYNFATGNWSSVSFLDGACSYLR